ncbi:MAG: divalent-cation tolerance protein CutA [Candidatus Pacebacteria bacterium]|nr:divalent-cation tolerance protein CutA [Candidatus Paceibacterota bacterium]
MIFIYTTCKNKKEAEKIGLHLVKKQLVACVNIFPLIKSIFSWQGKIEKKSESVLIIKTKKENFAKIEKDIKKISGFTTPCILEIPIARGNKDYLKWIEKEVKWNGVLTTVLKKVK